MSKLKPQIPILILAILLVTAPSSMGEQANIPREGQFALPGPHPPSPCSNLWDGIAKYASRGANYSAHWVADQANAYAQLAQGNPDAFLDQVSRTFSDMTTAAGYIATEGSLGVSGFVLEQTFKQILPDSGIGEFFAEGRRVTGSVASSVVVAGMEKFGQDVAEISHDLWDVIENIDDPEAMAEALGGKLQKWTPSGALTYMFTDGDPLKGAEKAAGALLRQADIMTTYIAPYAKAPTAIASGTSKMAKAYNKLQKIPGMPGPGANDFGKGFFVINRRVKAGMGAAFKKEAMQLIEQGGLSQQHKAALVTLIAVVEAKLNEDEVTGEHPFYKTQLRTIEAEWMKDSYEDGGKKWSGWHPIVENGSDCISLGDYTIPDRGGHLGHGRTKLNAICGAEVTKGKDKWWTRPIDYDLVWGDNCSGGAHDRSIWAPVCPNGYTGVGFVHWGGSWEKPFPNRIACLKEDPQLMYRTDGATAGLKYTTDDLGSGALYNVTIYNRHFAGMQLMYAAPIAADSSYGFVQNIKVPVAWGEPVGGRSDVAKQQQLQTAFMEFAYPNGLSGPPIPSGRTAKVFWTTPDGTYDFIKQREIEKIAFKKEATVREAVAAPAAHPQPPSGYLYYIMQDNTETGPFGEESIINAARTNPAILQQLGRRSDGLTWMPLAQFLPDVAASLAVPPPQTPATGIPIFTHQFYSTSDPRGRYYVTAANEFVRLTPHGQILLIGHVAASSDPRFTWILKHQNGWLGVDANGDVWAIDLNNNSMRHDGRVQVLQNSGAQGKGSNQHTPMQQETETYTYQLFDNDDPQALYYITSMGRVVGRTAQGHIKHLGNVIPSQDDSFQLMLQAQDGTISGINAQGTMWTWDKDSGTWQQIGSVRALQ